ncbi:MAG TPA: nucleotidyltransferase domain-containing protein, partial [Candidatus Krumholzibacteria bacterium]|nr:nucleotidyltransferase domain-containing protein [Candidatus Krumholzibacteria bacterium]
MRESLESLVEEARRALGPRLRAVVLGGSLARGEGVVLARGDTSKLLSDIDLYLVVTQPEAEENRSLERALRAQRANDPFFAAPLDLGFVDESWFSRLGST